MDAIVEQMARSLFLQAWADGEEEAGRTYPGEDIEDVAPAETPEECTEAAARLKDLIEEANRAPLEALYAMSCAADDPREALGGPLHMSGPLWHDEERQRLFGHYLAMQALGHGVSWFDDHNDFPLALPHIEFTHLHLAEPASSRDED